MRKPPSQRSKQREVSVPVLLLRLIFQDVRPAADLKIRANKVMLENEVDGQQMLLCEHHMYAAFSTALSTYTAAQSASQVAHEQEHKSYQQVILDITSRSSSLHDLLPSQVPDPLGLRDPLQMAQGEARGINLQKTSIILQFLGLHNR